ncbi:MAG: CHRD domain-containing protein [Rhodobacteraceae bacterium]|nr:MAG: CHRD domain-containing protein [Paracoccaceae bacterium]
MIFMSRFVSLIVAVTLVPTTDLKADQHQFEFELCTLHEVAAKWRSQEEGTGIGTITYDTAQGTLSFALSVTGVFPEMLASVGHHGGLGAIHIHNLPQGGPDFFVQHLPGEISEQADGFDFTLADWVMENPGGGADVGADFVLFEMLSGNAFVGLHTHNMQCANAEGRTIPCAAPATALSGQIVPKGYRAESCSGTRTATAMLAQ